MLAATRNSPSPAVTRIATIMPMTQPRTVRNLVHSACSSWLKPSGPSCTGERYGVRVVIAPILRQPGRR